MFQIINLNHIYFYPSTSDILADIVREGSRLDSIRLSPHLRQSDRINLNVQSPTNKQRT